MNSASAFNHAISGAMTEQQINNYASFIQASHQQIQNVGGWLHGQIEKTMDNFNSFVNSRAWEMSNRILAKNEGDYVGRFEIGYLGSVHGFQNAQGLMRDYIMANPILMELYQQELIDGYEGNFNQHCNGVGRDNLFYRKATTGLLMEKEDEGKTSIYYTHYHDTLGGELSFRERENIQKTWRAANHHIANTMFDITSTEKDKERRLPEEVED